MAKSQWSFKTAVELSAALAARKVSAVELAEDAIGRIERHDAKINAICVRDFERLEFLVGRREGRSLLRRLVTALRVTWQSVVGHVLPGLAALTVVDQRLHPITSRGSRPGPAARTTLALPAPRTCRTMRRHRRSLNGRTSHPYGSDW